MKKFFSILLLIGGFMLLNQQKAQATHLMGSDIIWKCLGKDTYKVIVTVYRDCNGVSIGNQGIQLVACGGRTSLTVSSTFIVGKEITPVCKKSCTRCRKGQPNVYNGNPSCSFQYGIEEFRYEATLYLQRNPRIDPSCCDVTVSWTSCCRNSNITTGPNDQGFYVEATLNRCAPKCDNSPYFTNPPIAIFCINQCITFNMGVNDDDVDDNGNADSLVYSITRPLTAARSAVTYRSPYTFDKPIYYDGFPSKYTKADFNPPNCKGMYVDSSTGDINFKATRRDNTVLAVMIESWGKDASGKPILKGRTRRDIQVILVDCRNNRVPTLSGINGGTDTEIDFCAGQKKCFTIQSYDPDTPDTVTVSWNNGIPGATFDVEKNKKHPKGTFCWEPGADKVRAYPYQFIVNANDDACPVNARTSKSFRVRVRPSPDPVVTIDKLGCGTVEFKAQPKAGSSISKYIWEGDDGLSGYTAKTRHHYKRGGDYKWILNTENSFGCVRRDSGRIKIDPYVYVELAKDSVFCQGDTSNVNIISRREGGTGPFTYKWNTGDSGVASIGNLKIFKDSSFRVTIYDLGEKCENYDTIFYKMKKAYKPSLGPDLRYCFGTPVRIGDSSLQQKRLQLSWYKNSMSSLIGSDTIITVIEQAAYILHTVDSVGCKTSDTINVFYNPSADVVKRKFNGCRNDMITMDAGGTDTNAIYQWKVITRDGKPVSPPQVVNNSITYNMFPQYDEEYIVTSFQSLNGVTCSDSDTVSIVIKPKPKIKTKIPVPICVNAPDVSLIQYVDVYGGVWSAVDTNYKQSVKGETFIPNKAKIGLNRVRYYYLNKNTGCDTTIILDITVDPLPTVSAGLDTVICAGDTTALDLYSLGAFPSSGGFWQGPGIFNSSFIRKSDPSIGSGKKLFIYSYTDQTKISACSNTDTMEITFVPDFYPSLLGVGPFCATDNSALLDATPRENDIFVHRWFVTDINTSANLGGALAKASNGDVTFSPSIAAMGMTGSEMDIRIVVEVSNKGRCAKFDTIETKIYEIPRPSFNMPTEYCISDGLVPITVNETTGRRLFTAPAGKNYVTGNYFNTENAGIGTHRVKYTYFDNSKGIACPADTYIDISVYQKPTIKVSYKVACEGQPFELTADTTNSSAITWVALDPTAVIVNQGERKTLFYPGANDLISGKFRVYAYATQGPVTSPCRRDSALAVVIIPSKPVIEFEADPLKGCEPLKVRFTESTNYGNGLPNTYEWDFGDGTTSTQRNPEHTYVYSRGKEFYSVTLKVTSKDGCSDTLTKSNLINVYPLPTADFTATPRFTTISLPLVKFEDRTDYKDPRLQSSATLIWNLGDGKRIVGRGDTTNAFEYEYKDTGLYTVSLTVRNQYGCSDTVVKSGYIDIRPEILVFIPNVFTPNNLYNDKTIKNEQFLPVVNDVGSFNLQIFSRWGELLFESNDQTKGWDGLFRSEECQEGVYVYVLRVTSLTGKKYRYTGSVTLLR